MNNFHIFRKFRQNSKKKVNLIEISIHISIFWNLPRNSDKISSKFDRKFAESDAKIEEKKKSGKNEYSFIHSRKKFDGFQLNF